MHRRPLGWMLVAALGGACAAREQAVETDASVPAPAAAPASSHLLTAPGGEGGQPVGGAASSVRAPLEAGTDPRAPAVPGTLQAGRESGFRASPSPDGMDAGVPIAPRRPSGPIPTMDDHRRAKPPPFDPRKAPPPGPFFPRGPSEAAPGTGNDAGPLAQ